MKKQKFGVFLTIFAVAGLAAACALPFSIYPTRAQDAAQSDPASSSCPKCKGAMEQGVIIDYWAEQYRDSTWAPGNPKWRVFAKMPKEKKITAYRCTNCGYLESYAK